MLRFIASGMGVLACASLLLLKKQQDAPSPEKSSTAAKVAIPQIEPRV